MGERISNTSQNLTKFSNSINAPLPISFSWKGKSFYQIISTVQQNGKLHVLDPSQNYTSIGNNIFLPQPIKHYRKEIGNVNVRYPLQSKRLISIDELNSPGGQLMINGYVSDQPHGLDKMVISENDVRIINNTTEHPGLCKNGGGGACLDIATNARRRIRSSGVIKKGYNMTSYEYLNNRNKSFQQNSFQYLQIGNSSAKPGTADAAANTYRTQSYINSTAALYDNSGCNPPITNVYFKPSNWRFSQQGSVDSSSYTLRRKFDSVVNNIAKFKRVYGTDVGNSMGGGIATSVYTYKDKLGFPLPKRPKPMNPTSSIMRCCNDTHISGGMRGNGVP